MKIVIVGYGEMFNALVAGVYASEHEIIGVFRHENVLYNPFFRFLHDLIMPSDNYKLTKTLGLYDIKATSVNSDKFRQETKRLKANVILVGSWSEKFSVKTINNIRNACINVHPSLLPKYRGPNPYLQTILHNEKTTGITFHLMDVNYDTGSILHQAKTTISDYETGLSLKLKCTELARQEVSVLLNDLKEKIKNQTSQNEKEASYFHNIQISDTIIDFNALSAEEVARKIRAFTPWIQCHIPFGKEFFTFKTYKILDKKSKKEPSTIVKKKDDTLYIVCNDGTIMKFSGIRLKRPILNLFSKQYLNRFVQKNSKAV